MTEIMTQFLALDPKTIWAATSVNPEAISLHLQVVPEISSCRQVHLRVCSDTKTDSWY